MICLNAHGLPSGFGIHIWIPVTIATDPSPPAQRWQREWRPEARRCGGLLKATERVVEAAQQSRHQSEDRSIKVHQRRTNLIKGGDAPGADAAHAPEVGHLFTQSQINLGGEGAAKCAPVKQRAHATECGDQRAAARLGRVRGKNGQVTDLCGGEVNRRWHQPRGAEIGERCVKAARAWGGGRMRVRTELCGAAALLNQAGESEAQRQRPHDALHLDVLLS